LIARLITSLRCEGAQLHLAAGAADHDSCPDAETHRPIEWWDASLLAELARLAYADPIAMADLRRMVADEGLNAHFVQLMSESELLREVAHLVARQHLRAIMCRSVRVTASAPAPAAEERGAAFPIAEALARRAGQELSAKKVKTWIQIELVDQDGKPVPNEKYRLVLPDGTVQEGKLDENGQAGADGIDPGTCKVSFPDIHAKEWNPA